MWFSWAWQSSRELSRASCPPALPLVLVFKGRRMALCPNLDLEEPVLGGQEDLGHSLRCRPGDRRQAVKMAVAMATAVESNRGRPEVSDQIGKRYWLKVQGTCARQRARRRPVVSDQIDTRLWLKVQERATEQLGRLRLCVHRERGTQHHKSRCSNKNDPAAALTRAPSGRRVCVLPHGSSAP